MVARLTLVAFGLLCALLLLAAIEGVLALFGVGDDRLFDDPLLGFAPGETLFVPVEEGGERVYVTRRAKLAFFNEQRFRVDKQPGTLRVFVLGGSTAAGRPYDDHVSFARWLERYLDLAEPDRPHEVINAGGVSYASYRLVVLARELARYRPDAFIVYTGHNEFLEERTYGALKHRNPTLLRAQLFLSRFRLAALVRQGAASLGLQAPPPTELRGEVETRLEVWHGLAAFRRDPELERTIVEQFAQNLQRLAGIARAAGVPLLLVSPASNLADFSPFKSEASVGLAADQRRQLTQLLARGQAALAGGDPATATDALGRAVELDSAYAEAWYQLGRAHLAAGDCAAATTALLRAADEDAAPLRARQAVVAAVGDAAARFDLPLLDLPAILANRLAAEGRCPVPGNEHFLDHVHPEIGVHQLIAKRLVDMLARLDLIEIGAGWTPERRAATDAQVLAGLDRSYYARRDLNLGKVLGWAGKLIEAEAPLVRAATALPDEPDAHLNLGILYQKTGRPELAASSLRRAVELAPALASAHFNLGVTLGQLGALADGVASLERAVELEPDYAEAWHDLGVLRREAGQLDGALAALERALVLAPQSDDTEIALARTLALAGRVDDAERRLRSGSAPAAVRHRELTVMLLRSGRTEAALGEINAALATAPSDPEAHFLRAQILTRLARRDDAIAAYRVTLALAPENPQAHNNLAIQLAAVGQLAEAEDALRAALAVAPEWSEAWLNLGVVLDQAGRRGEAIEAVERARQLAPDDPRIGQALALLQRAAGRS